MVGRRKRPLQLHLRYSYCYKCICWLLGSLLPIATVHVESLTPVLPLATKSRSQYHPFDLSSSQKIHRQRHIRWMSSVMTPSLVCANKELLNSSRQSSGVHILEPPKSTKFITSSSGLLDSSSARTKIISYTNKAFSVSSSSDSNLNSQQLARRRLSSSRSSKPRNATTTGKVSMSKLKMSPAIKSNSSVNQSKRRVYSSSLLLSESVSSSPSAKTHTSDISVHQAQQLLTQEEEVELAYLIQQSVQLQDLFDSLRGKLHRNPTDEEWVLASDFDNIHTIHQVLERGLQAKNELVTANLRMVQHVVNMYVRNGLGSKYNVADMISEGTMALIVAAEKFDPALGFRFSTYAMYWIRAYVKRSQIVQSSVIYVPPMVHDTHRRICEITQELTTALQRKPTLEEIAKFSNLKKEKVEQVIFAVKHQHCYSLDANLQSSAGSGHRSSASMNPDNKKTLYDLVACQAADVNEIELQEKRFLKDDLINFMKRYLSPQEVNLLLLRFGMIEEKYLPHRSLFGRSLTIGEVAQLVGLKPTKARRLINRSLSRLKSFIAHEWCPI